MLSFIIQQYSKELQGTNYFNQWKYNQLEFFVMIFIIP
jgi:hypothetical protein